MKGVLTRIKKHLFYKKILSTNNIYTYSIFDLLRPINRRDHKSMISKKYSNFKSDIKIGDVVYKDDTQMTVSGYTFRSNNILDVSLLVNCQWFIGMVLNEREFLREELLTKSEYISNKRDSKINDIIND